MDPSFISYIDTFDRYLAGEMKQPEATAFEQQLKENPALAQAFADYQAINADLQAQMSEAQSPKDEQLLALARQIQQNAREKGLLLTEDDVFDFVLGTADAETGALIDHRVKNDPVFATMVDHYRQIAGGLRDFTPTYRHIMNVESGLRERSFFEKIYREAETGHAPQKSNAKTVALRSTLHIVLVAASIVTLLVAVWFVPRLIEDWNQSKPQVSATKTKQSNQVPAPESGLSAPSTKPFDSTGDGLPDQLTAAPQKNPKPDLKPRLYTDLSKAAKEDILKFGLPKSGPAFGGSTDSLARTAEYLKKGQGKKAVESLPRLINPENLSQKENFIVGQAFALNNQYDEAIRHFDECIESKFREDLKQRAEWLRALCQFHLNRAEVMEKELDAIILNKEHPYRAHAIQLKQQLK